MAYTDSPRFQPSSLQSLCLEVVADNFPASFSDGSPSIQLSSTLSDQLMRLLDENKQLTVQTVPGFSREQHVLRHLQVSNLQSHVKVLQTFRGQPLETVSLTDVYVLEALESLGQETVEGLRAITVRETNSFIHGFDSVNPFTRLVNVVVLNVPGTLFSDGHLREVAGTLKHIRRLDLTNTDVTDVSPLLAYAQQLMWLSLRSVRFSCVREAAKVWAQLEKLCFLDVSWQMLPGDASFLLEPSDTNPDLQTLVLAKVGSVPEEVLRSYLQNHRSLQFLDVSFNHSLNGLHMGQYSMFDPTSPAFMEHLQVCSDVIMPQLERGFDFSLTMKYEGSVKGYADTLFNHVNYHLLSLTPQCIELLIKALAQMGDRESVTVGVLRCVSAVMVAEQKVSVDQLYRLVEHIVKVLSLYCNKFGPNVPFFDIQSIQEYGLRALEKILEWSVSDFKKAGIEDKKYKSGGQRLWFINQWVDVAWTCVMAERNLALSLQALTVAGSTANHFYMSPADCDSLCSSDKRVERVLHLLEHLSHQPPSAPTSGAVGLLSSVLVYSKRGLRHVCGERTLNTLWHYLHTLCGQHHQFHQVSVQRDVIFILTHLFLAMLDKEEGCENLRPDFFYNDHVVSILRNHLLLRDPDSKYTSVQHCCGFLLALMVTQGHSHWSNVVTEYSLQDALQLIVNVVDVWGDEIPDDLVLLFWYPRSCGQLLKSEVPAAQLLVLWEMHQLCASTYLRGDVYDTLLKERELAQWLRSVEPGEGLQERLHVMATSVLLGWDRQRKESRSY